MGMCVFKVLIVYCTSLHFRTIVSQVPASPIFSLQINPSPDLIALVENPIMMIFDVVRQKYLHIYILRIHTYMHTYIYIYIYIYIY